MSEARLCVQRDTSIHYNLLVMEIQEVSVVFFRVHLVLLFYGFTGALVTNIEGAWYQIGIVSTIHGAGCTGTFPNLHTKITPYLQWISEMSGVPINP